MSVCVCSRSCPACKGVMSVPYCFSLSHERHDYGKKLLNIKLVLDFPTTWYEKLLIPRRNERVIVMTVQTSSCKVPIILGQFLVKVKFSVIFIIVPTNIHGHTCTYACTHTPACTHAQTHARLRL